jgi:hypothetical protein
MLKASCVIKKKDEAWKQLRRDYDRKNLRIQIGVQGREAKEQVGESSFNMASLAAVHEYGSTLHNIPARHPILHYTFSHEVPIREMLESGAKEALKPNSDLKKILGTIGEVMVSDLKYDIEAGNLVPPLKEETIEARERKRGKRTTTPLLDTGTLRNSYTSVVGYKK